ncbi:hypothetical protein FHG87_010691 [Trinorchestia longiramus]|nr:hypothetical protein FHG87_010691 [Trinorchestia longiramus]
MSDLVPHVLPRRSPDQLECDKSRAFASKDCISAAHVQSQSPSLARMYQGFPVNEIRDILQCASLASAALAGYPRWTIEECALPTGPDHPVTPHSPSILSLSRMVWISEAFWFQYSWSALPQDTCGLENNVLYFVQRKQSLEDSRRHFTFTSYPSYREWLVDRQDGGREIACRGSVAALGKGSYGFASCENDYLKVLSAARSWRAGIPQSFFLILLDYLKVLSAARSWRAGIPQSFFLILLGLVAGLVLLISIIGLLVFFISKKKFTGFFSLHNHRLDTNLAAPPTTFEPPNI